jgi:RNA polymerase sigma-70 factor (ECF subfamily)
LTEVEAQEVVQEVMIASVKKMPGFTYEPGKDSLKGWLLSVTRWKVADQFRKRQRVEATGGAPTATRETRALPANNDTARTATADRVPDPGSLELDAIWEGEWRENLLRTALERMKQSVNPAHYEMYHLHVVQGLTPRETARALGVSRAAVYLAKHRVGRLLKKEIQRLENETR